MLIDWEQLTADGSVEAPHGRNVGSGMACAGDLKTLRTINDLPAMVSLGRSLHLCGGLELARRVASRRPDLRLRRYLAMPHVKHTKA